MVSDFQNSVYSVCKQIPPGRFSTYGRIAQVLNTSPRAVGGALKRNPYAPQVPCHRVISSNFSLGGFYGEMESAKKIEMLRSEGIEFDKEFRVEKKYRDLIFEEFKESNNQ
ncbi:DNA binding methylated-DNA--cysteine S-methyltransferase [Rozella allomycis CSF55]|uniref:Methylated-DNA--protein-cysteine methyltransferase n=1 Tax=Rozella allomycis (strain CSF55) TaxID=988480 RepID=A0A075B4T9_ROZAC|nr:Methylated-DNA-[protein]-cysteine S-methyltransferase domain-containing protein [Rozella allomycis CSF55]RKP16387.1 DNA binding methylated-DNA--cysteine S-methyltransferase [Rozella allomycis CSF55]RKP16533.1 DNA binding methylated-DNA--cysteine S-methyltransferase [Rozella allomycis CSF55]|eukprot:EPZ36616.1 Methylated-DNA-[protein]-cysteine S-methyltransferase domain-containing protein [Rozella allomycis CSF55]